MEPYCHIVALALSVLGGMQFCSAQYPGQLGDMMKASLQMQPKALAFDYADVRLLDGPFMRAMETDRKWLDEADADRFLHAFKVNCGIRTGAQSLGGWESLDCEVRGHTTGHLLSALALMYAATGDETYRAKGGDIVEGLAECQRVLGDSGYLSAFPEYFIDRAIKQDTVWAPWYTLHKLYAGLYDQYTLCGNRQAMDVLLKMCDWACDKLEPLGHNEMQRMLTSEFGGMPEVLYNVYGITGNVRYKTLADKFYHDEILNPLAAGRDSLAGIHVNTQIPKVIGEARGYELTGNERSREIATYFWDAVVSAHTYVTGGNSDREVFSQPYKLSEQLGENTTETCNTYNMLKLTRHLFTWNASSKYADYYERALYNHILSSQDPVSGGVTYYHTLPPGSHKVYHYPFKDNTCCVGTGYENHAKYGEAIYYRTPDDKGLYVNLFIASELDWAGKGLRLRQETNFPDEGSTRLHIIDAPSGRCEVALYLRCPSWAEAGGDVIVKVNGKRVKASCTVGSYIEVKRTWKCGDVVTMELPMTLHIETMPDNGQRCALLYGPIVLAIDMGTEAGRSIPTIDVDKRRLVEWLIPVEGEKLTFKMTPKTGDGETLIFKPLFRINEHNYSVYFDCIPTT